MLPLGLLLLCLGFLLPGHYSPWVSFQQQWLAALGVTLVALGVAVDRASRETQWSVAAWVAFGTALVPLVQLLTGQIAFVSDAVLASLYVAGFGLCIVAGATCSGVSRSRLVEGLCGVFVAAGIASTGIAARQWLQLGPNLYVVDLGPGARPFANLAQPNHLATLLGLAIIALLRWYELNRIRGWVTAFAAGWLAIGLLMTQSRTGWLIVVAIPVAWQILRRQAKLRLRAGPVIMGVLACVVGLLLWDKLSSALYLTSQPLESRLQPGTRTLLWPVLVDAIGRAPWFGYGWNQVALAQQAASLEHPSSLYLFTDSHNLFLDLLLWNGVPIGATLGAILLVWAVKRIRACHDADRWALLLALTALFLHSMVEYPYDYAYFLLPAGLLVGVLEGDGTVRRTALPRTALVLPTILMMAMLSWIGIEYMNVEQAARQLRFVQARIGLDRVSTAPVPDVVLLDGLREAHRFATSEARPGLATSELDRMHVVAQRNASAPILFRYALAAGLNGRVQDASNTLGILCKTNTSKKCAEGRAEWRRMQQQNPELASIPFPSSDR